MLELKVIEFGIRAESVSFGCTVGIQVAIKKKTDFIRFVFCVRLLLVDCSRKKTPKY